MTDIAKAGVDTPVQPPADHLERWAAFIGNVARPFAIISTSFSAAWASIVVSYRVENGNDAAILMGAIFAGVGALYGFKAWERRKESEKAAEVEIARTQTETR